MPLCCWCRQGNHGGARFCRRCGLPLQMQLTIGRHPMQCHLVVEEPTVSRRHAALELDGSTWFVTDLNSKNGTFLNETRLTQRTPLALGDVLRVGSAAFRFNGSNLLDARGRELLRFCPVCKVFLPPPLLGTFCPACGFSLRWLEVEGSEKGMVEIVVRPGEQTVSPLECHAQGIGVEPLTVRLRSEIPDLLRLQSGVLHQAEASLTVPVGGAVSVGLMATLPDQTCTVQEAPLKVRGVFFPTQQTTSAGRSHWTPEELETEQTLTVRIVPASSF